MMLPLQSPERMILMTSSDGGDTVYDIFSIIQSMAKNFQAVNTDDGDYIGEDGLLVCGKCHTPKQYRLQIPGDESKTIVVPVTCKHRQDELKAEEERLEREQFERRVREIRKIGISDAEFESWTFENDDRKNPKLSDAMKRYADNFQKMKEKNMGLLLYGNVGTGKTYYAACIANALIDKGIPVLMTNFIRIINKIQTLHTEDRQHYLDELQSFPLLIIDDLGAERQSEFMLEQVYNIIDARYRSGLPLIVTTNIDIELIKNPPDIRYARIYDRVLEMCHPVKVDGNSRRREGLKKQFAECQKLLGL